MALKLLKDMQNCCVCVCVFCTFANLLFSEVWSFLKLQKKSPVHAYDRQTQCFIGICLYVGCVCVRVCTIHWQIMPDAYN